MARIRTIKPEFWSDEKVADCSMEARLLFIGSWNFADDEGRMEYSPKRLKMQIFPGDNIDVEPLVNELAAHRMVEIYEQGGRQYLQIKNFKKHQRVNKPYPSILPPSPSTINSTNVPGTLTDHSTNDLGMVALEGNGREEERNGASPLATLLSPRPSTKKKQGAPVSEDFQPDESHRKLAREQRVDVGVECAKFVDYHRAHGSVLKDWPAAFRNWLRNANRFGAAASKSAAPTALPANYVPPSQRPRLDGQPPLVRADGQRRPS